MPLAVTFDARWHSVIKECGKQSLKYEARKYLNFMSSVLFGYFGSASIVLLTKSAKLIKGVKILHSACSGRLDIAELYFSTPINIIEIAIFGRLRI